MKKHNILKVVLLTILVVVICTWIIPSAQFQATLTVGERLQAGFFDFFSYPMVALQYFGNVLLYILICGMFYGVAYRIPAYKELVQKIVDGFKGMEVIFLSVVIILLSVLVSVTGIVLPIIFVFPFIIDVVLKMGYNRLTAATVTIGSVVAGIAGTTLGVATTQYMNQVLAIGSFDEMLSKIVILVIFIILLIAQVVLYSKKTKNTTIQAEKVEVKTEKVEEKKVEVSNKKEEKVSVKKDTKVFKKESSSPKKGQKKSSSKNSKQETKKSTGKRGRPPKTSAAMAKDSSETLVISTKNKKKANIWPLAIIFDLVIIIIALGMFDWAGLFEITWFEEATKAVKEYKVLGFPIFGTILGQLSAFGKWNVAIEVPVVVMIATCVLALVYRVKFEDFIDGICEGVRRSFGPGVVMLLTYVVLVVVTYHPFQLFITKFLLNITSGFNVVTMMVAALLASVFNVDLIYVSQNVLPYIETVITNTELYPLIGVIFQSIYGLVCLVAPTSFILMGTLCYLNVSYKQWLKHIWKLFLALLAVLAVVFLIILAL